jgi:hypothetical protein
MAGMAACALGRRATAGLGALLAVRPRAAASRSVRVVLLLGKDLGGLIERGLGLVRVRSGTGLFDEILRADTGLRGVSPTALAV